MWLRYYIEDKVGVCIINSIPHCFSEHFSMAVWNTIDDTYSNFVLYIVTKPHFLIFASFQSIFTMVVWNTISDRYSNFCIMQKRSHISLFLPFHKAFSIGQCGILSMIDSPILSSLYIETKPHFLIFASFERFLVWLCGILSMIHTPTLSAIYSNEAVL